MPLETRSLFRFGPFRLDPGLRILHRRDEQVALRPRVFDTLLLLVEKRGEVVTKEELIDAVWPDTVVEENNLNQNILALRRMLEAAGNDEVRIETVPRRGYRLIAPQEEGVQTVAAAPAPAPGARIAEPPMRRTRPALRRRRLAMAALAAGAIVIATGAIWRLRHATRPISGVRSIAVLPLKSLGLPAGGDYVGLGIADAVITRLGYARTLSVRPTASVQGLRESGADPVAAGRALHVDAVLDGQIQKSGDRIRVTVQLIGVREGSAIWSEKFDVKAADLFTLEDSISESVVRALASGLSAGEAQRVGRDRPTTPEAYRAYLEGRYFWNRRTLAATGTARQLFEHAIALDPSYAPAYAGLADTLNGVDSRLARQAAERALALDDSLAEAYASLGNTSLFSDWNVAEAEKDFQRALDLNPSYATAHQWYAYCFLVRGDLPGAQQEVRRAQLVDPLSPSIGVDVALMLYYGRHYDDAILELRRVLELQPGFGQATQLLPVVLLQKGELEAAKRECPPISSADPNLTNACLALVAAHTGDRSAAEQRLEGIAPSARWFFEALVAIALGDGDRAMTALEVGYRFRDPSLLVIGADPLFDDLHSDPRFLGLLQRIGVTPLPAA